MPYDSIGYEVEGHTATVTLNRPDALNALSPHMITELRAAYDEAENDDDVWSLIVTGTGRAFCTGADVKAIPDESLQQLQGLDAAFRADPAPVFVQSGRQRQAVGRRGIAGVIAAAKADGVP